MNKTSADDTMAGHPNRCWIVKSETSNNVSAMFGNILIFPTSSQAKRHISANGLARFVPVKLTWDNLVGTFKDKFLGAMIGCKEEKNRYGNIPFKDT